LLTIEQVLTGGPQESLVVQETNLVCLGVAYYLTFEQRLLTDPALDRHVARDTKAVPPSQCLEGLVGLSFGMFTIAWQTHLANAK